MPGKWKLFSVTDMAWEHARSDLDPIALGTCTGVGMEVIEGLRFLASLPLAGTGRTEGGEKTQPFKRFHSRLFSVQFWQNYVSIDSPINHEQTCCKAMLS